MTFASSGHYPPALDQSTRFRQEPKLLGVLACTAWHVGTRRLHKGADHPVGHVCGHARQVTIRPSSSSRAWPRVQDWVPRAACRSTSQAGRPARQASTRAFALPLRGFFRGSSDQLAPLMCRRKQAELPIGAQLRVNRSQPAMGVAANKCHHVITCKAMARISVRFGPARLY